MTVPAAVVCSSIEELSQRLARAFVDWCAAALREQPRFSVALSGGSTPESFYKTLAAEPYRGQLNWDKIHLFWGDDRFVPPDDPASNYRMVRRSLLEKVPLPAHNIHPMPTQDCEPGQCALDYERHMRDFFGDKSAFPTFDVMLLGLGEDGHTASLFPGTPALQEKTRWVTVGEAPVAPHVRLTMTFPVINHSRRIVFLAAGQNKAPVIDGIFTRAANPPASRVSPVGGDLTWWMDAAAAGHHR